MSEKDNSVEWKITSSFVACCDDCIHEDVCKIRDEILTMRELLMEYIRRCSINPHPFQLAVENTSTDITVVNKCDKYKPQSETTEASIVATNPVGGCGGNNNPSRLGRQTYDSPNIVGSIRAGDGGFDLGLPLPEGYVRQVPVYRPQPQTISNIDRKPF